MHKLKKGNKGIWFKRRVRGGGKQSRMCATLLGGMYGYEMKQLGGDYIVFPLPTPEQAYLDCSWNKSWSSVYQLYVWSEPMLKYYYFWAMPILSCLLDYYERSWIVDRHPWKWFVWVHCPHQYEWCALATYLLESEDMWKLLRLEFCQFSWWCKVLSCHLPTQVRCFWSRVDI